MKNFVMCLSVRIFCHQIAKMQAATIAMNFLNTAATKTRKGAVATT